MWIKTLYLHNFRNYEKALIEFSSGVNYIQGNNAQGKTNLLEAIYFLSTGRSFRTDKLTEMIKEGESYMRIEVLFEKEGIEQRLSVYYDGKQKRVETNDSTAHNFSTLLGLIPSVIATPGDIQLIMGAPQLRRRYLNIHIAQSDPLYVYHLSRYNKALKQRNACLKMRQIKTIGVWEEEMALSGSYLVQERQSSLDSLSKYASERLAKLSRDDEKLELKYQSSLQGSDLKSALLEQMDRNRNRELQYGSTQVGPHRDDILIEHNGKAARLFSSEGQKQTLLASLRFAEQEHLKALHQTDPLFGIDDFGNHLDNNRITRLRGELTQGSQTFLTTPDLTRQKEESFLVEGGSILKLST